MEVTLPKRIFGEGNEPEVERINNCCRTSLLKLAKERLPTEYEEVKRDPVFAHVMAIYDNGLAYSGRLVHSMMCRQLETSKQHELWFVFGRRPLRFSMQEFYAVTGLKYEKTDDPDFGKWVDDNGFWSKVLNQNKAICIRSIRKELLFKCNKWTRVDRLRLVYLCVIAGMLIPMDEKSAISHTYIRLVMDLDKLRSYHWGLDAFDELLQAIKTAKPKLVRPISYPLHGFSYALLIWIMEAIPDFGTMLGTKKIEDTVAFPRCSNWSGSAILSYLEFRRLESTFGLEATTHPFISPTGNNDIVHDSAYRRRSEMRDERVDLIYELIRTQNDWSNQIWEVKEAAELCQPQQVVDDVEAENESESDDAVPCTPKPEVSSATTSRKGKSRIRGIEERKKKVLCERAAGKNVAVTDEMKSFMKELFETSFTSMAKKLETEIADRFSVVHSKIRDLRDLVQTTKLSTSRGEPSTSTKAALGSGKSQSQKKVTKKKNT